MKRLFDLMIILLATPLLLPVFLLTAWLVRQKLGTPIFFRQTRPGLDGKPFEMIKFRSMTDAKDAQGNLLSDADRLTPFGRWLRASSLDELPELWNVIKGDMSLVGPRPLLMEYLPLYSAEQAKRHAVKPGITGWAQVNGRNAISWEEKFALDSWYVDHQSPLLDLRILWLTVKKVLFKEDISAQGEATMPKFTGSQSTKLAILGASGHGKVVADIAQLNGWQQIHFYDDAFPEKQALEHWPIIGNSTTLIDNLDQYGGVFVAIGNNAIRREKYQQLHAQSAPLVSLIHPKSTISEHATVGMGSVIMAGAVVNPFATIAPFCIINTSATIDHDCHIGEACHISPGANLAGNVSVAAETWIGIGACIKQGMHIGHQVMVGAGAVVVHHIPDHTQVVGTPAKPRS